MLDHFLSTWIKELISQSVGSKPSLNTYKLHALVTDTSFSLSVVLSTKC